MKVYVLLIFYILVFPMALMERAHGDLRLNTNTLCGLQLQSAEDFNANDYAIWNNGFCLNGQIDFSTPNSSKKKCRKNRLEDYPVEQRVSGAFLKKILTKEPYRSHLKQFDVKIVCAAVEGDFDVNRGNFASSISFENTKFFGKFMLTNSKLEQELRLYRSEFDSDFSITESEMSESIIIERSRFQGPFSLYGTVMAKDARFSRSKLGSNLNMSEVEIGGDLIFERRNRVSEFLDAGNIQITGAFVANNSIFSSDIDLTESIIGRNIYFLNSTNVSGTIDASFGLVGRGFFVIDSSIKGDLVLNTTRIEKSLSVGIKKTGRVKLGGNFLLDNSQVAGPVILENLDIRGRLSLNGVHINNDVKISPAVIVEQEFELIDANLGALNISSSVFRKGMQADRAVIRKSLHMKDSTTFGGKPVLLNSVVVKGQIDASNSVFQSPFYSERLSVGGNFFIGGKTIFNETFKLFDAQIGGHLNLSGGKFKKGLDITGSQIGNALILSSYDHNKKPFSVSIAGRFILTNSRVGMIEDSKESWCTEAECKTGKFITTELTNFVYDRADGNSQAFANREKSWLLNWIKSGQSDNDRYNPKPYIQLATVVRSSGDPVKADEILFEMQNHEAQSENTPVFRKMYLWFKWALIGYGYENWRALVPLSILIGMGAFLCPQLRSEKKMTIAERIWFSVDKALPIINLGACEHEANANNWVINYFYIHQSIGFILASFLLAGLSGFAK